MTAIHPAEELLAAYLEDDLDRDEEIGIETHLRECDLCVSGVVRMRPHLDAAGTIAVPVPANVRRRLVFRGAAAAGAPRRSLGSTRPPFLLRWPVLIPTSLAAGFLLAASISTVRTTRPSLLTRAVRSVPVTSVSAVETVMRRLPAGDAEVVANLPAGENVTVIERRSGWIRVERSGGGQGWVPSEHLR
jgi:anti-sigma factor RsiW